MRLPFCIHERETLLDCISTMQSFKFYSRTDCYDKPLLYLHHAKFKTYFPPSHFIRTSSLCSSRAQVTHHTRMGFFTLTPVFPKTTLNHRLSCTSTPTAVVDSTQTCTMMARCALACLEPGQERYVCTSLEYSP